MPSIAWVAISAAVFLYFLRLAVLRQIKSREKEAVHTIVNDWYEHRKNTNNNYEVFSIARLLLEPTSDGQTIRYHLDQLITTNRGRHPLLKQTIEYDEFVQEAVDGLVGRMKLLSRQPGMYSFIVLPSSRKTQ